MGKKSKCTCDAQCTISTTAYGLRIAATVSPKKSGLEYARRGHSRIQIPQWQRRWDQSTGVWQESRPHRICLRWSFRKLPHDLKKRLGDNDGASS